MINKYKWYLFSILVLVLIEVSLVGAIGIWREYFWNAVEQRMLHKFIILLAYFSGFALIACFVSGFTQYLINYLSLLVRTDLTHKAVKLPIKETEGFEQRVQEDCAHYPWYAITLSVGLLRNALVLAVFIGIIIHQVGILYVGLPIVYVLVGTFIAYKLAKPLINLNYLNQCLEAKLRRFLITYKNKQLSLSTTYAEVFDNNHQLFKTTKVLAYFQSFYNQVTVIIPYVLMFSLYFSSKITFGVFMQVASSMAHIIDSMSYFINSFNDINNFLSCRKRLVELGVI